MVGRRQALGWLGAAVCSVALVVAGGLMLSSVAVSRYLQASSAVMSHGTADSDATPDAAELATVEKTVDEVLAMPGVATASNTVQSPEPASPVAEARTAPPSPAPADLSYDVSVIMDTGATSAQAADVVFAMTRELQNSRVNLELSIPLGDGHAASVVDYRHAFDAPVTRDTVDSVSQAVAVAAAVPGVQTVRVTVPYTWNLSAGDLEVDFMADDARHASALKQALARTALSGVSWVSSR